MVTSEECLLICLEVSIPCVLFIAFSGAQHSNKRIYIWSGLIFVLPYKLSPGSSVVFLIMLISVLHYFRMHIAANSPNHKVYCFMVVITLQELKIACDYCILDQEREKISTSVLWLLRHCTLHLDIFSSFGNELSSK